MTPAGYFEEVEEGEVVADSEVGGLGVEKVAEKHGEPGKDEVGQAADGPNLAISTKREADERTENNAAKRPKLTHKASSFTPDNLSGTGEGTVPRLSNLILAPSLSTSTGVNAQPRLPFENVTEADPTDHLPALSLTVYSDGTPPRTTRPTPSSVSIDALSNAPHSPVPKADAPSSTHISTPAPAPSNTPDASSPPLSTDAPSSTHISTPEQPPSNKSDASGAPLPIVIAKWARGFDAGKPIEWLEIRLSSWLGLCGTKSLELAGGTRWVTALREMLLKLQERQFTLSTSEMCKLMLQMRVKKRKKMGALKPYVVRGAVEWFFPPFFRSGLSEAHTSNRLPARLLLPWQKAADAWQNEEQRLGRVIRAANVAGVLVAFTDGSIRTACSKAGQDYHLGGSAGFVAVEGIIDRIHDEQDVLILMDNQGVIEAMTVCDDRPRNNIDYATLLEKIVDRKGATYFAHAASKAVNGNKIADALIDAKMVALKDRIEVETDPMAFPEYLLSNRPTAQPQPADDWNLPAERARLLIDPAFAL
ncbi:hypothetical protein HK104_009288 [Borealophlyctis nickersoniae]|nr:hypothetical protein HK104_009288 [Borealophlyctis nickersoniae]